MTHDLVVIGAGPGGYTAAVRAARCGLKTALVERERPGGVCLNWGCIPTKALLRSAGLWQELRGARRLGVKLGDSEFDYTAIQRRSRQTVDRLVKGLDQLFESAGVELIAGEGRLDGPERVVAGERILEAPRVILATGGAPRPLPEVPFDGERILSSRDALELREVPPRLLIIGAGAIGLEFADLFATFGSKVTVVEMLPQILPAEDPEVARVLLSAFQKRGIKIHTSSRVSTIRPEGEALRAEIEGEAIEVDRVLVAIGVAAATEGLGVACEHGFVATDEHLRTTAPGVYAIGDLTGPPLLAHVASAQGVHAAEHAAGLQPMPYDPTWTPAAVFTHPAVASVGEREDADRPVRVGRFPFSALGRAVAEGEVAGLVKVVIDPESERLLGAQIVGPQAAELIAPLTVAGRARIPAGELLRTIWTHPTFSEAIAEAIGDALGRGIHV